MNAVSQIELYINQQDTGENVDLNALTHAIKSQYPSFIETANTVSDTHERVARLLEQVEVYRKRKYGNDYESFQPAQSRGKKEFM